MVTIFGSDQELQARQVAAPGGVTGLSVGNAPSPTATILGAISEIASNLGRVDPEEQMKRVGQKLATRLEDIDGDSNLNSFQKSEARAKARQAALIQGGPNSRVFLDSIAELGATQEKVTPTGDIQIINKTTGEVIGVKPMSVEGIRTQMADQQADLIDEYFPTVTDSISAILPRQLQENSGALSDSEVTQTFVQFKDVATSMQSIEQNYLSQAASLPAAEQEKLIKASEQKYLASATQLFGTFTSPVFQRALKQPGGFTQEDAYAMVSAAEKDFLDEVAGSGVPVDINAVRSYTSNLKSDLVDLFSKVEGRDLNEAERQAKLLNYKNQYVTESFLNKNPDLLRTKEVLPVIDAATKLVDIAQNAELISQTTPDGSPTKALIDGILNGVTNVGPSVVNTMNGAIAYVQDSNLKLNTVSDTVDTIKNRAQLIPVLSQLKAVLNNPFSAGRRKDVLNLSREKIIPKLEELVTAGEITAKEKDQWISQLNAFDNSAKNALAQTGAPENDVEDTVSKLDSYLESIGTGVKTFLVGSGKNDTLQRKPLTTTEGAQ